MDTWWYESRINELEKIARSMLETLEHVERAALRPGSELHTAIRDIIKEAKDIL